MIDRTTKILLGMIALGLWAHLVWWLFQPMVANAQNADSILRSIDSHLSAIYNGVCINHKICS
jgi:type II secretory pathway component PulM